MNSTQISQKRSPFVQRFEFQAVGSDAELVQTAHPKGDYVGAPNFDAAIGALRDLCTTIKPEFLWNSAIDKDLRAALSSALIEAQRVISQSGTPE